MKKLLAGAALAAATSLGGCLCVARGARIRTPKGERFIEELAVGDEVLCVDPQTGQQYAAPIAAIRSSQRECVGLGELMVTSDHPVYSPDDGAYHDAGDWALGTRSRVLKVSDDGVAVAKVLGLRTFAGVHTVFDLTVDHPLHNFVANGVLVHNKSRPPPLCELPDGGKQYGYVTSCVCTSGGIGELACDERTPSKISCIRCGPPPPPDAGPEDAGETDAGAMDAGDAADAGVDAGSSDGG